ncbi:regulatory helix-turn-helix protein, lysR family [Atopostipes suicloacalis DSM 15692]|uniref:Regulatory helix-turn-helix protein, lysR family n=1 Tax=Atopostipes suicloacalis DSM 15692 TaxID=1121025 RepID=A0A1M4YLP7_9LACT|nr:LysR family transcriptional regulator [Atopostipes suicloacalis]SHF06306.1 regulatory helix-turn-helix protein, lysR family [Atopostipes suicloacalis DSM 15692]
MNFKLLETFIAVIDHQTMSRAAEHLFTSQPNVSMMIMKLEDYFSTKLFYRTSKGLQLTPV